MRRTLFLSLSIGILFLMAACDMVTPVSKSERLSMFIDDLNVPNYGDMPDHFSQANLGGGWNSVTDPGYWSGGSDGWNNNPFSSSILSSTSSTITTDLTNGSSATLEYTFYFVEEEEDIWSIYRVDKEGAGTILQ